jgi:hypothetical protein
MSYPVPFNINISNDALLFLKARLDSTVFPDELDEAGWDYGAPLTDIKRLTQHWRNA